MKTIIALSALLISHAIHADIQPPVPCSAVENCYQVTSGLYRGGRPANEAQIQALASLGIKTIVNLQGGDYEDNWEWVDFAVSKLEAGETPGAISAENALAAKYNMVMVPEPLDSMKPITADESATIDQVLQIMNDPSKQPVFVHCAHGKDRTGLVNALFRVRVQNADPVDAYEEMRRLGHDMWDTLLTWPMDLSYFNMMGWLNPNELLSENIEEIVLMMAEHDIQKK